MRSELRRLTAALVGLAFSAASVAAAQEVVPLAGKALSDTIWRAGGTAELTAAFELTAGSARFGGLSGLHVAGDRLVAVSDRGRWVRFRLRRDPAGRLIGVGPTVRLEPILDAGALPVGGSSADAEGMAVDPRGRIWVSFERGHRVTAYDVVGGAAQAEASQLPIRGLASNGGVEGLAVARDGALLAVIEDPVGAAGRPDGAPADAILGWRMAGGAAAAFWIPRLDAYAATGAALGPEGALYLLERRYSFWTGVRMRIRRFRPEIVAALAGAVGASAVGLGSGEVAAQLGPSGPIDNMEGLAVEPRAGGGLWLWVISDDNFSGRQRTILLQYAYAPPE